MNCYTFNDVLIKPQYSSVTSRKNIDTSVIFNKIKIDIPIMSSNMKSICNINLANEVMNNGGWVALHRFNTIDESVEDFKNVSGTPCVSVGVNGDFKERISELYSSGARYFCIDVAHGYHKNVHDTILYIKSNYSDTNVIAGNIATGTSAIALTRWGADGIKVGIGNGSVCSTRTKTGVGVPQLYALHDVYNALKNTFINLPLIISDGGVVNIGDISKALAYSDIIMSGSLFSRCKESNTTTYYGSASINCKGSNTFVEGFCKNVSPTTTVKELLHDIKDGIQSSCSYVGATNLTEFKEYVEFIHISNSATQESKFYN